MKIKGMMYDVGRDVGGNEKYYRELIERLAGYGYNMLILNLEYRFQFPSHPEIGMPDGLTPEKVRTLDDFAKEHGIELVPFMNCAGHCEGIGMTEKYNHLCADDIQSNSVEQLCINMPEAVQLALDLFNDLCDCFSGKYFHVGGDEIRWLQKLYPELEPDDRMKKAVEFLNLIIKTVKSRGKIPMVWGDMLLKHQSILENLDSDVLICDWSYFTAPDLKQLSNIKTLSFFKDAKRPTVFCNSASSFYGNPMMSDTSTMNIVYGSDEYFNLFGDEALGIITTVWEIQYGGFFDVVWPWLYLQSKINNGEKRNFRSLSFLGEYTSAEWGLPEGDDSLEKWHRLMDVEFTKFVLYEAFLDKRLRPSLEANGNRPCKMMRMFFNSLFRNRNILPFINNERRTWLTPYMIEKIEEIYRKALLLAEHMDKASVRRKEEARHLLQYNKVMLAIIDLLKLETSFENCYHRAAEVQFTDNDEFKNTMNELKGICLSMAEKAGILAEWINTLYEEGNYAADACVIAGMSVEELLKRADNIGKIADSGVALVSYRRFISRDADLPMIRHIGKDYAK